MELLLCGVAARQHSGAEEDLHRGTLTALTSLVIGRGWEVPAHEASRALVSAGTMPSIVRVGQACWWGADLSQEIVHPLCFRKSSTWPLTQSRDP